MVRKDLKRLLGKIHSMHLAVPGAVAHLYHIQCALAQAGAGKAWLSPEFHHNISDWRMLVEQTAAQPTHLDKIFCCKPPHMRFCDALGLGAG